jgi:hypothetical protein
VLVGGAPARAASAGSAAALSPRGTRLLSIGLPAELGRAPERALGSVSALLERGAERIPIARAITSFGTSADADVRLVNGRAGLLHAQLLSHEGQFFLRDLGSASGSSGERNARYG